MKINTLKKSLGGFGSTAVILHEHARPAAVRGDAAADLPREAAICET